MHDATGRYTSTYDDLNRTRTAFNPASKKIAYAYDSVGQRDHMFDPDGSRFT